VIRGRAAVTGRVDPNHFVIAGEVGGDRSPAVPVLGEAMDDHESRSAPVGLRVQQAQRALIRH
jgi:hypothetical protein